MRKVSLLCEEDILGFDVQVHDPLAMEIGQGLGYLLSNESTSEAEVLSILFSFVSSLWEIWE